MAYRDRGFEIFVHDRLDPGRAVANFAVRLCDAGRSASPATLPPALERLPASGGQGLRCRMVPGNPEEQWYTDLCLDPGPEITRQNYQAWQAPIAWAQQDRDHVRSPERLAARNDTIRKLSEGLPVRRRPRLRRRPRRGRHAKTLYPEPKQFIAKAAVEGSDEGVLLRLSGIGAVLGNVVLLGPF